mgnify:FL=1
MGRAQGTHEVVVALADGNECGDEVVLGSVLVVKGCLSEPVGERVDAERGLRASDRQRLEQRERVRGEETYVVNEHQARGSSKVEPALPVSPTESSDGHGEEESHRDDQREVPAVLPLDDLVLTEIADISDSRLATGLEDHPADVRPEKPLVRRVGVEVGVGVAVVSAVAARPPLDGAFDGAGAAEGEEVLEGEGGGVGAVRPEAMVASGDACDGGRVSGSRRERGRKERTKASEEVAVG